MNQLMHTHERGRDEALFDFRVLWGWVRFGLRAPLRHKLLALSAFLLTLGLALGAAWALPYRYLVKATLLAQRSPLMTSLTTGLNREWDAPARAAREMVIRRDSLTELAKKIGLVDRYLATASPASRARLWLREKLTGKPIDREDLLDSLVDGLEKQLWVVVAPEGSVTINFVWSDPGIAYDVAQAGIDSFLAQRHQSEVQMVSDTITILEAHEAQLQTQIASALAQLEQKEKALQVRTGVVRRPAVVAPRPAPGADPEQARLQAQLAARRRAISDLESFRERRLSELQVQLQQQLGIYAAEHPAVRSTQAAIEAATEKSPQVEALQAEAADLEKQILAHGGGAAEPQVQAPSYDYAGAFMREPVDPRLDYERRQLDELARQDEALRGRIAVARVELDTAHAAFKYRYSVITPPQMPQGPMKPYGPIFVLGGLMGGLFMAILAAAAADIWSGRVVERCQIDGLDLPVLAELRK